MHRRDLVSAAAVAFVGTAGCLGSGGDGQPTETPREPQTVTTTNGEAVAVAETRAVRSDDGLAVAYRLRNDGDEAATVEVETILRFEGGGTFAAGTLVDVPAGEETDVEYRVVRWDDLSGAEREAVESGSADLETYVNGERR